MKLDPEDEHLRGSLYIKGSYATFTTRPYQSLHRVIMSAQPGMDIDHMNGDTLDNRKANLRVVTRSQNKRNTDITSGRSKHRGVIWHKGERRWLARIVHLGKVYHLGYFKEESAANSARLLKEKELWGIEPRRELAFAA